MGNHNLDHIYTYEEVQGILKLAIARQGRQETAFSQLQLTELAEELGLSHQDLQEAETLWRAQQGDRFDRNAFNTFCREQFQQHAVKYLIFNAFLVLLDFILSHGPFISPLVMTVWGLALALDARATYLLRGEAYEQRFQRWRQRRLLRQSLTDFVNRLFAPAENSELRSQHEGS